MFIASFLAPIRGRLLTELTDAKSIGAGTRIPIGIASSIIAAVLGVGWALASRLTSIDLRLQSLEIHASAGPQFNAEFPRIDMRLESVERHLSTLQLGGTDALIMLRDEFEARIDRLEAGIAEVATDRFRGRDMDLWIEQAKARGVALPDRPAVR